MILAASSLSGGSHRLVVGHQIPVSTNVLLWYTFILSLATSSLQPARHICTRDIKEYPFMLGMITPFFASGGNSFRSRLQSWVDCMTSALDKFTLIGCMVGQMFVTFACLAQKLWVAPVSPIPQLHLSQLGLRYWVGVETSDRCNIKLSLFLLSFAPPHHMPLLYCVCCPMKFCPPPSGRIVLCFFACDPPIGFWRVAFHICPSHSFWQKELSWSLKPCVQQ